MIVQSYLLPFDEELLPARHLSFGNFSCIYEHGRIRYVKSGGTEIIRMIYFAVRDPAWKTAEYNIENEVIEENSNGFTISYTALHQLHEIAYRINVEIKASNNLLVFRVNGDAETTFKRNRIGICVLHPVKECRGRAVQITRPEGSRYDARFPDLISPHQPFKDIKNIQTEAGNEIIVQYRFDGDIFETEDQRNWADSSFKTYSTPLELPMPVTVKKGEQLRQEVAVEINGSATPLRKASVGEMKLPFPKLGYDSGAEDLDENHFVSLRELPFDHYRVKISLATKGWERVLYRRCEEALKLETRVELAVVFSENMNSELEKLLATLEPLNTAISSILLLQEGRPVMQRENFIRLYREIKQLYPYIQVGFGTGGFFADINRNRPSFEEFDFVSFSLNPQVHSTDTRSVLENLQQLGDLVQTARSISLNKPVCISPITFKIPESGGLDSDQRLHRNFGALWTLVAIKHLATADRLTFYQVSGYRGIIQPNPTPLFNLLKLIKSFNPKWIIHNDDNETLCPDKVVMENERGERLRIDIGKEWG